MNSHTGLRPLSQEERKTWISSLQRVLPLTRGFENVAYEPHVHYRHPCIPDGTDVSVQPSRVVLLTQRVSPFFPNAHLGLRAYDATYTYNELTGLLPPSALKDLYSKLYGESACVDISAHTEISTVLVEMTGHRTGISGHQALNFPTTRSRENSRYILLQRRVTWEESQTAGQGLVGKAASVVWCSEGSCVQLPTERHFLPIDQMQAAADDELNITRNPASRDIMSSRLFGLCNRPSVTRANLALRGVMLIVTRASAIDGCVWCYLAYEPEDDSWTLWLRRAYVKTQARRTGVLKLLTQGAIALFSSWVNVPIARIRTLAYQGAKESDYFGRLQFQPLPSAPVHCWQGSIA